MLFFLLQSFGVTGAQSDNRIDSSEDPESPPIVEPLPIMTNPVEPPSVGPKNVGESDDIDLSAAFSHLNVMGLLNVSEINSRYHKIIAEKFIIGEYGLDKKLLQIKGITRKTSQKSELTENGENRVIVESVNLPSKLLENFGYLITKIEVDGNDCDWFYLEQIVDIIGKNCKNSLISVTMRNMERMPIIKWQPFEMVENVVFNQIELYKTVHIPTIFPNLRTLDIYPMKRSNLSSVVGKYEKIEHFGIHTAPNHDNEKFVREFVQVNENLESLTLADSITMEYVTFLRDNLPNLTALHLISSLSEYFPEKAETIIHFKNVTDFSVTLHRGNDEQSTLPFPFLFDNLRSLTWNVPILDSNLIDSIVKNSHLERLVIQMIVPSYSQLKQIVDSLPKLKEINVQYHRKPMVNWLKTGIGRLMQENLTLDTINLSFQKYQRRHDAIETIKLSNWEYVGEMEYQFIKYSSFKRKRI